MTKQNQNQKTQSEWLDWYKLRTKSDDLKLDEREFIT